MRIAVAVVCVSSLLLTAGAIAGGCVANAPIAPSLDSGLEDVFVPPTDATMPDTSAPETSTPDAGLSSLAIDFGLVNCGTGAATKTYSLTNPTASAITYSASLSSGAVFTITSGASASVAPGATGSITISVSGIPTTAVAGTPLTGTLTLTTNVPGATTVNVPLTVTPQGGSIAVSPATAAFGQAQLGYGAQPIPLALSNTGNAPVSFTLGPATHADGGVDTAFGLVYPGSGQDASVTLAAGATLGDAGATFVPTVPGDDAVTLPIRATSPLQARRPPESP